MADDEQQDIYHVPEPDFDESRFLDTLERGRAYRFGREEKVKFLKWVKLTGQLSKGARAAGVSQNCVRNHLNNDPAFAEAYEEAYTYFKDSLEAEMLRRAVRGWKEPVVGGKDKDEVVTHVQKFDSQLLQLALKRHIPEYREKYQVDANVSGGVLVVGGVLGQHAWQEQFGGTRTSDENADE